MQIYLDKLRTQHDLHVELLDTDDGQMLLIEGKEYNDVIFRLSRNMLQRHCDLSQRQIDELAEDLNRRVVNRSIWNLLEDMQS